MSFELQRQLRSMEERIEELERRLGSYEAALALSDSPEIVERRKPGRPRKVDAVERSA